MKEKITLAELVELRRVPPGGAHVTLVEAVSLVAFKAYLTRADLDRLIQAELSKKGTKARNLPAANSAVAQRWFDAAAEIFKKAGEGKLTLRGRKVARFGADAEPEPTEIPPAFFSSERALFVGVNSDLYVGTDPDQEIPYDPNRATYREVRVLTDKLMEAFPYTEVAELPTDVELREQPISTSGLSQQVAASLQAQAATGRAVSECHRWLDDEYKEQREGQPGKAQAWLTAQE